LFFTDLPPPTVGFAVPLCGGGLFFSLFLQLTAKI
jgi:hypothetical protein